MHSSFLPVAYLFHFQRRHVQRNCLESKCISLSPSVSLCLLLALYFASPPLSLRLSIYLGLPRELPVFRSVASRQYIFQVLMGRRHMLVLTLIARSILALSFSFSFSPLLFPIHRMHPRHPSNTARSPYHTDIAIEEDLPSPAPRRYYEYKIFRSRMWIRTGHELVRRDDDWHLRSFKS